jgi:diguanylate cyclase (GGDEF)-like protein
MSAALLIAVMLLSPLAALLIGGLGFVAWRQRRTIRSLTLEARHDPLTGLPNRRAMEAHWINFTGDRALVFIDLVGFKAVNDRHGHIVGDALLQQVARRLAATVPPPGLLARWGGDEFVALVPVQDLAAQQARIVNAGVMAYDLSASGGPVEVRIGARIGASGSETDFARALGSAARALLDERAVAA